MSTRSYFCAEPLPRVARSSGMAPRLLSGNLGGRSDLIRTPLFLPILSSGQHSHGQRHPVRRVRGEARPNSTSEARSFRRNCNAEDVTRSTTATYSHIWCNHPRQHNGSRSNRVGPRYRKLLTVQPFKPASTISPLQPAGGEASTSIPNCCM